MVAKLCNFLYQMPINKISTDEIKDILYKTLQLQEDKTIIVDISNEKSPLTNRKKFVQKIIKNPKDKTTPENIKSTIQYLIYHKGYLLNIPANEEDNIYNLILNALCIDYREKLIDYINRENILMMKIEHFYHTDNISKESYLLRTIVEYGELTILRSQ